MIVAFYSPYLEFAGMILPLFIMGFGVHISKKENLTGRYRNTKKIHTVNISQIKKYKQL